jgi:hypothetical protein
MLRNSDSSQAPNEREIFLFACANVDPIRARPTPRDARIGRKRTDRFTPHAKLKHAPRFVE